MEPMAAEVETLGLDRSIIAIGTWTGWDDAAIGQFFVLLGFSTDTAVTAESPAVHPRFLCMFSEEQLNEQLNVWMNVQVKVKPATR